MKARFSHGLHLLWVEITAGQLCHGGCEDCPGNVNAHEIDATLARGFCIVEGQQHLGDESTHGPAQEVDCFEVRSQAPHETHHVASEQLQRKIFVPVWRYMRLSDAVIVISLSAGDSVNLEAISQTHPR